MELSSLKKKKIEFEKQILRMKMDFERELGVEIIEIKVNKHDFFAGDRISTIEIEIRI
jgi:hypothetical protein